MAITTVKSSYVLNFSLFLVYLWLNTCLTSADWETNDYMKREHSLIKPYSEQTWDIMGSVIFTNNYIRLTPDHQSKKGAIWNNIPNYSRDWELHVHFKVHGSGTELFGDGFGIWYTKERNQLGNVFGNKDYFVGLGVFFDTYSNHNGPHNHGHPYISAMVNNGSQHYDHDRDGTHTELAGCEAQFRGAQHETYAAIRYEQQVLTVSIDIEGKNNWKPCFTVKGVRLPIGYYFGASAATGELADNHDIISMKLYQLDVKYPEDDKTDYSKIEPGADFFASPRDHIDDPKGSYMLSRLTGWRLLIIIIVGIVGLGICAMVAFILFSKRQEDSRKRFY